VPSSRMAAANAGSKSDLGVFCRSTLKGLSGSGARIWWTRRGSVSMISWSVDDEALRRRVCEENWRVTTGMRRQAG